jgi:acetyl-CoA decarbonylase/synthase complex subunit delta
MPFLPSTGEIPHQPLTALEFWDVPPRGWGKFLEEELSPVWETPAAWGRALAETHGAKLLFLRLMSAHPDYGGRNPGQVADSLKSILAHVKAPLIVVGCGIREVDQEMLPAVAEAAAGENLLLGNATAESYVEITDACIQHGHSLITESPIDINIAKQVNILVQDRGLAGDRIVMYATTGALGYGLEYAYSIMENTRLLGLAGDRYMNKPQIAFVGQETWRAKEAARDRESGIMWEAVTGLAYFHAGADVVVARSVVGG